LRAYRCVAYIHIPKENRPKLQATAIQCVFVGYTPTAQQYKLYNPVAQCVIVSTAPTFAKDKRLKWDWKNESTEVEVNPFDPMKPIKRPETSETTVQEPTKQFTPMLESPKSTPESDDPDILTGDTIVVDTRDLDTALQAASAVESVKIPETYAEAMSCADSAYWKQAVSEELTKLQALDTWSYTELPPGKKLIGFTWVFTVKYTLTGLIDRYKARLVAQGFS
jgi:hypothetical protein